MAVFFYNIFLGLFRLATHIAALFNQKADKWVKGRKKIFHLIKKSVNVEDQVIWVHCASLGEFEQGRPVIESLKNQYPAFKILLTFFSPSGYEAQKNNQFADWVFYLPLDGPKNSKRFLEIIKPSLVIFVKYEFWYYYLKKIKYRNIPLLLISASFRKDMAFFKWYGKLQRKMLSRFDHLFVQNIESKNLLKAIGLSNNCTVSGDTRFDRVIAIANHFEPLLLVEKFIGKNNVIIAGSTWPSDEAILQKAFNAINNASLKIIIAPHEINEKNISFIKELFPYAICFSHFNQNNTDFENSNCLIIDNIGMLSKLYKYATIAYIGGGMKKSGVHNVLEAAVYNKPVLYGPYYKKYTEAVGLILAGGGLSFYDDNKDGFELKALLEMLLTNKDEYERISLAAGNFVQNNRGASGKIIQFIQENRLLTSLSKS